jgi:hemerythrin
MDYFEENKSVVDSRGRWLGPIRFLNLDLGEAMAIANWSSRFETGIAIIDTQHKALFAAVNQLAESFRAGTSGNQAKESLDFLMKHAAEHFSTEEKFMQDMNYPKLTAHMADHAQMSRMAQELQTNLAAGNPITMEVTIFLADYLQNHINQVDMGYVDFVKEKNHK